MDSLTHFLTGVSFYYIFSKENKNKSVLFNVSVISAMIPDIDVILKFFNKINYLFYHRGVTHSIFIQPIIAFILSYTFYKLFNKSKDYSLKYLFLCSLANLYFHLFLDLLTSFGTMVLYPILYKRFSWDLFFIIEWPVLLIFIIPLIINVILIKKIKVKKILSFISFALLIFYIFFSMNIKHQVKKKVQYITKNQSYKIIAVLPQTLNIYTRKIILEKNNLFYVGEYRKNNFMLSEHKKFKLDYLPEKLRNNKEIEQYLEFTRFPVYDLKQNKNDIFINIYDLRFVSSLFSKIFFDIKIFYNQKNHKYKIIS